MAHTHIIRPVRVSFHHKAIYEFLKKNVVMVVAFVAALATSFIVPVYKKYLGYFDFKTL